MISLKSLVSMFKPPVRNSAGGVVVSKPPHRVEITDRTVRVFLAGSIEMGKAVDWQTKITEEIREKFGNTGVDVVICNPRRDDWDSSWTQSIENPKFKEQVDWELDHLLSADVVAMYFDENTKSPITLMELGMVCGYGESVVVYSPDGFWRKGNVDIVCLRNGNQVHTDYDGWRTAILNEISIATMSKVYL